LICKWKYRILKECINNIVKHANATLIVIDIGEKHGQLEFIVTDNGVGFNPKKVKFNGLLSIENRILAKKGKMDISPAFQGGTKIHFSIPTG
jgi:signal transduction histidine kinase